MTCPLGQTHNWDFVTNEERVGKYVKIVGRYVCSCGAVKLGIPNYVKQPVNLHPNIWNNYAGS